MSARKGFSWIAPLMRILLALGLLLSATAAQAMERVTYYHNDALGSPVAATDSNGTLLWRESYAPYGERLTREASGNDTVWYTGKQEEAAFGLNYFGARWYDPKIGRFMGVDPAGFSADNIQSFNRYAYANNNPYLYVDPDGREPLTPEEEIQQMHAEAFDKIRSVIHPVGEAGQAGLELVTPGMGILGTFKKGYEALKFFERFADPKFARQLERQLAADGPKSVKKSLASIEKNLAEHKGKLDKLKYRSSVEREIRTYERQVETANQFMKEKGIE